jgi:hypothetical protein
VWYLAEILFAEPARSDLADYACESCNVVFRAAGAAEAYHKAVAWGRNYADDPPAAMRLLGVSQLTLVGEELLDGTEISGRFFTAPAVWERREHMIPPPEQLAAVQWEQSADTPLERLLTAEQIEQLKQVWHRAL